MTKAALLLPLLFAPVGLSAQQALPDPGYPRGFPRRYAIDPPHSQVGFVARFMGMSTVRGAFGAFGGDLLYVPGRPDRWSVSALILAASINTNSPARDRHLKSPDFLGVEEFPYITFRSSRIRPTRAGFVAEGELALHGVTKQIELPFTMLNPPRADAWGNARMSFQARYRISRKEFDIKGTAFWNSEFDPGRMAVADAIDIELLISAVIPNVEKWTNPVGDSLLAAIREDGVDATIDRLKAAMTGNSRWDSLPDFPFVVAGRKLLAAGDKQDGVALYDALVALRPRSQTIMFEAGEAWLAMGDTARARARFEAARQLDSTDTSAAEWLLYLDGARR